MNDVQLSHRLRRVADFIPQGAKIADIGSDHAYLPCYLCLQGHIPYAIATEINDGPFQLAKANVRQLGLQERIDVRKGDGLKVLYEDDDVDCIVIAGMGGTLIASILDDGKEKLTSVRKLILQPNVGENLVRSWLSDNGWRIEGETILEEDGKIYEIIAASQGNAVLSERELLFGPYLMREKNDVFRKKWTRELTNWRRIMTEMEAAKASEAVQEKRDELRRKIKMVEEVLQ